MISKMFEKTRPIGLDKINGNFVRSAPHFRVKTLVVHNTLPKPCFFVQKEDRENSYSQKGVLHISVADLGRTSFPAGFGFDGLDRVVIPSRTVFTREVEIGSIKIGQGTTIGAGTKIGPCVRIGEGAEIGPNCRLEFAEIREKVMIGADSKMRGLKIGKNTVLGPEAFIDKAGIDRMEIGSSVRIGAGLSIPDSASLKIESDAVIGDNVTVLQTRVIGAGARIESGTLIKDQNIKPGETVRTKDAPNLAAAFSGELYEHPADNPQLSPLVKQLIAALRYYRDDNFTYDYTCNATLAASQSLSRDSALFLYPQVHPLPKGQLVRVVGKNESVVFFNDRTRIYYGGKEIPDGYVAEERRLDRAEYSRLNRFSFALLTGYKANQIAVQKYLTDGEREAYYGITPLDKFYLLLDYLRVKLGWSADQPPRLLDLGFGLADAVKVAGVFTRAEGIENNLARFRLALKYTREKASLHYGNFFDHDLSVYDLLYLHLNWGEYDLDNGVGSIPFVGKLRQKMKELNPRAMVIVGPIQSCDWFYDITIDDTKRLAARVFSNLKPVKLKLPDQIEELFAFFKK